MQVDHQASTDDVLKARDRYVPRGVSTPHLVVTRAWGARIWDADGREYLDFAGGIACQNLGHGPAGAVRATHHQAHKDPPHGFFGGPYDPSAPLCQTLAELSPRAPPTKSLLLNSRAAATANTGEIARP